VVRRSHPVVRALFATILVVAACNRDRSSASRDADSLAASIPPPAPPPPRALSRFDVPLDYDFTPVLAIVERAVPRTFGSLDSVRDVPGDSRKHYTFAAARDNFEMFASGSEVHLRTTVSYRARVYYKPFMAPTLSGGCGNDTQRPRIILELVTPITVGPDWHLHSDARLARLEPASDSAHDRCNVSMFSYDITPRVMDAARNALTNRLTDIDQRISMVDLTPRAKVWWRQLNQPIRLANDVWLMLQPKQLRLGSVNGTAQMLTVRAGLDASPTIVTGPKPFPVVKPLPPLGQNTKGSGFQILLEGNVDYLTASQALTKALQGRVVTEGGQAVTIHSAMATADTAGRIALSVSFTGDATGRLRLVGTPRYSAAIGMVDVPDLEYDLTTDKDLINVYAWLRSEELLKILRDKARVPIAPALDRGKELLVNGLNRTVGGVMRIRATVDSVAVDGLYATSSGLLIRARALGKARVAVRQAGRGQ
jgi:hypothetical protein